MTVTTHGNDMWGVVVWSGDIDGNAALITSTRLGCYLWVFQTKKGGFFSSAKCWWEKRGRYKDKEFAFASLGIKEK